MLKKITAAFLIAINIGAMAAETSTMQLGDSTPTERQTRSFFIGHNVSPTSYTPQKGTLTLGFYIAGYAITDNFIVATSPWMYAGYNMYNLIARYGRSIGTKHRLSLTSAYFQTYNEKLPNRNAFHPRGRSYSQESTTQQFTYSHTFSDVFALHTTYSYLYFWREERPYSLRMSPGTLDPSEHILSQLLEWRISRHWRINGEIGGLGLNYVYPYWHYGASIAFQSDRWLAQFGLSRTTRATEEFIYNPHSGVYEYGDAIHPEVQVQWFL